jgi:hypothetical protein
LSHPDWDWFIATLCRASDPDRAPKFKSALTRLNARGMMADLDDGPAQLPLPTDVVQQTILTLLPPNKYDFLLTHSPHGEYTRHVRHEETGRVVLDLWEKGVIQACQVWVFAYSDGRRSHLPQAEPAADCHTDLDLVIWRQKYQIMTQIYGFSPDSWEARSTPRSEAFWRLETAADRRRLERREDELS